MTAQFAIGFAVQPVSASLGACYVLRHALPHVILSEADSLKLHSLLKRLNKTWGLELAPAAS